MQEFRHDPHHHVPQVQRRIARPRTPSVPGRKGQDIFEHVSAKAWADWQKHQTLLINEKRLSLIDPATRVFLDEQREKFFRGEQVEQAEGWKPE